MSTVLELYEKLKPKLGEEETRALLEFVETSIEHRAATKEDLQRTEAALRAEIQSVKGELQSEIHRVKVDLLKWSFAFWIGAIAILSGIMATLLRSIPVK